MLQIARRPLIVVHNGHTQRRRQEAPQNSVASVTRLWHMRNSRTQQSAISIVKTSCTESDQNRFVIFSNSDAVLVMRKLIAPLTIAVLAALALPASAETRIFIVENQPDGYGIDQCLASGANCGKPMASAYCQSRRYGQAVSFRKAEPDEITRGGASGDATCRTIGCVNFVAIECER